MQTNLPTKVNIKITREGVKGLIAKNSNSGN